MRVEGEKIVILTSAKLFVVEERRRDVVWATEDAITREFVGDALRRDGGV